MERHFCRVGERFVHYRRCGAGPTVVLLHQTPQSSVTMEPLMHLLGGDVTCIAIDTPGFGLSDPLPGGQWSMADLSQALADTLDVLGITRAAFCGQHTGATIAAEFARRWPQRVSCLALDGYTVFSRHECETVLPHQLYRFQPRDDGTHLLWAWSRFRDGWMFFPWSVRSLATRRDVDMPPAQTIHDLQIMELLRSGESHLAVYPAVFGWDGQATAQGLTMPSLIAGTADDQLYPHLDRLHGLAPQVRLLRCANGARAQLMAAQVAHVRQHGDGASSPPAPRQVLDPATHGRCRAYAAGLAVNAVHLGGDAVPLVVLHGAGSAGELELAQALADGSRPAIAIDLPGHGDSGGAVLEPAQAAARVMQALKTLGLVHFCVWGRGLGAAVAVELALALQGEGALPPVALDLHELRLWQPGEREAWSSEYAPPITPQWDGSHLLRLWHEIRDRQFFLPWYTRTRAAIRPVEPQLDAQCLTDQVFAALRCTEWALAHRVWFAWPVQRLEQLRCPTRLHAHTGDGWARDLATLRAVLPA